MQESSVEAFLGQVARRGSWFGGGSAAALSAALAAALLEKLTPQPAEVLRLRRYRRDCLRLIDEDARRFARVIRAMRLARRASFVRSLQAATEVPCRVIELARTIQRQAKRSQRGMARRFHSDAQCVIALARAAEQGATALVRTNLAWLGDRPYTRRITRRLQR